MFYEIINPNSQFYVQRLDVDEAEWTSDIRKAKYFVESRAAWNNAELWNSKVMAVLELEDRDHQIELKSGWEPYA